MTRKLHTLPVVPASPSPSAVLLRALGVVAAVCGVLIVATYQLTLPAITRNKALATQRSVLALVADATGSRPWIVTSHGLEPGGEGAGGEGPRIHAAYDADRRLRGIAVEASARGYGDVVRVLYRFDLDTQRIVGLHVLGHRETPGIGDKILSDAAFVANFEALEAKLDADGRALAHPIVTVRHGTKKNAWEIDAISGATVTSRAVGRALDQSAQLLVPRLAQHAARLHTEAP